MGGQWAVFLAAAHTVISQSLEERENNNIFQGWVTDFRGIMCVKERVGECVCGICVWWCDVRCVCVWCGACVCGPIPDPGSLFSHVPVSRFQVCWLDVCAALAQHKPYIKNLKVGVHLYANCGFLLYVCGAGG